MIPNDDKSVTRAPIYRGMLEYPQILARLAGYARTAEGKARALALEPMPDPQARARATEQTLSARAIFDALGAPPIHSLEGLEDLMDRCRLGEIFSLAELKAVEAFLNQCRLLRRYAERAYPIDALAAGYGLSVDPLEEVRAEIERCIRGEELADNASALLRSLRTMRAQAQARIKENLASLLRAHPEWFMESFHSQRGGRFVLPVRREYRAQVRGVVLDASGSGATVFVEPDSVRAQQDEIDRLSIEESNEELRILAELSALVAGHARTLSVNRQAMIDTDYAFACGRLGSVMRGAAAEFTPRRELLLEEARHPLLEGSPVPLSLALGGTRALVITGPNTGGKTVALKTIGLLTLMAMSGLLVPARRAVIPQFSGVYCDIGDGQSIAQNLSTFSSHVRRIVDILAEADGRALVLLDELGSGTDPQEGMGLAVAVLEEMGRRACLLVATSHYPEIKRFAGQTPGFMNARMTFDRSTLSPLYRLEMGAAGESCALYIARRLGVPERLLARAWQAAYPDGGAPPPERAEEEHEPTTVGEVVPEEDMPVPPSKSEPKPPPSGALYALGDCVEIPSMRTRGIVCKTRSAQGEVGVRIQGKNYSINEKRLRLFLKAEQLYPGSDYDLDIVLNTWEYRKSKRDVEKGKPGASITLAEGTKEG